MERKQRKTIGIISLLMCVLLCTMLFITDVSYAGSVSKTYSGSFTKAWTGSPYTKTRKDGTKTVLKYWYNTVLINEDGTEAYDSGVKHYSRIVNGKKDVKSQTVYAREYSELEITHSGKKVTYYCCW